MDNMAMMLGYLLMGCGALYLTGVVMWLTGASVNRCLWCLIESLGGIKHFNRYREWLLSNKNENL